MTRDLVESLERYRSYLRLLVDVQLNPNLRSKVDASGVIQQTLLEAYAAQVKTEVDADQKAGLARSAIALGIGGNSDWRFF